MYTVNLNKTQMERLQIIVSSHLDLNIQPQLNAAMEKKLEERVKTLLETKQKDGEILTALMDATYSH